MNNKNKTLVGEKTLGKRSRNGVCPVSGKLGCAAKEYLSEPNDTPTVFVGLGFRCIYTILAWVFLGKGVTSGFFVSIALFEIPLWIDYLKFKPCNKTRKTIRSIGIYVSLAYIIFSCIGLFNILIIEQYNEVFLVKVATDFIDLQGVSINLNIIWRLLIISPILTIIDWVVNKNTYELESVNT